MTSTIPEHTEEPGTEKFRHTRRVAKSVWVRPIPRRIIERDIKHYLKDIARSAGFEVDDPVIRVVEYQKFVHGDEFVSVAADDPHAMYVLVEAEAEVTG